MTAFLALATIIAYREKQTDRRGMIMIDLYFDIDEDGTVVSLDDEHKFVYFESAFKLFYGEDGSVQLTSLERLDDDTLTVSGTFSGVATDSMSDLTIEVTDGNFTVGNTGKTSGQ